MINILVFLEQEASLGETMSRAGLNTLMGLGVVFLALAFIACVIALEGKIFTTIAARKAAPKTVEPKKEDTPDQVEEETVEAAGDDEIAAVIAAAICAFEADTEEPVPADALVVRSIRRLR